MCANMEKREWALWNEQAVLIFFAAKVLFCFPIA